MEGTPPCSTMVALPSGAASVLRAAGASEAPLAASVTAVPPMASAYAALPDASVAAALRTVSAFVAPPKTNVSVPTTDGTSAAMNGEDAAAPPRINGANGVASPTTAGS